MVYKEYFSEAKIEMQLEIKRHHPELWDIIKSYPQDRLGEAIAVIAAYINVIMDGIYENDKIEEFYHLATLALKKKRTIEIVQDVPSKLKSKVLLDKNGEEVQH